MSILGMLKFLFGRWFSNRIGSKKKKQSKSINAKSNSHGLQSRAIEEAEFIEDKGFNVDTFSYLRRPDNDTDANKAFPEDSDNMSLGFRVADNRTLSLPNTLRQIDTSKNILESKSSLTAFNGADIPFSNEDSNVSRVRNVQSKRYVIATQSNCRSVIATQSNCRSFDLADMRGDSVLEGDDLVPPFSALKPLRKSFTTPPSNGISGNQFQDEKIDWELAQLINDGASKQRVGFIDVVDSTLQKRNGNGVKVKASSPVSSTVSSNHKDVFPQREEDLLSLNKQTPQLLFLSNEYIAQTNSSRVKFLMSFKSRNCFSLPDLNIISTDFQCGSEALFSDSSSLSLFDQGDFLHELEYLNAGENVFDVDNEWLKHELAMNQDGVEGSLVPLNFCPWKNFCGTNSLSYMDVFFGYEQSNVWK